jgi:DNA helicase HerA-like ATPase
VAVLELKFDFDVLDKLHEPSFMAIERKTSRDMTYLIYEVVLPRPTHFQMLGMDVSLPITLRKEYLRTIDAGWGQSEETWIDVIAVPTEYKMEIEGGQPKFSRARLVPLIGSPAHLLSKETVQKFLCIEGGVEIGKLMGFNIDLTVNLENLARYHAGIFGFTGSGKSNLTSYLIRRCAERFPDLRVLVFDVAGEYSIHLLDLLGSSGAVFSTEDFDKDAERFISSQAIPETLEGRLSEQMLRTKVEELLNKEAIRRLTLEPYEPPRITLELLISILEQEVRSDKPQALQVSIALKEILQLERERGYDADIDLRALRSEDKERLANILTELAEGLHEMSALRRSLERAIRYLEEEPEPEEVTSLKMLHPESLATLLLEGETPQISVVYIPNPDEARHAASRLIERLLLLKKTKGARRRVLVVLDEAQEFIPDRSLEDDFSKASNRAVEALLRQGRKYRAFCWISSQRVAHLNVSALQQLHSYFVSTLPRFYDRMVIADAFSLNYDILERTTQLETGQWLFVSYKATKQRNVPVFIQAPNNEDLLLRGLGA